MITHAALSFEDLSKLLSLPAWIALHAIEISHIDQQITFIIDVPEEVLPKDDDNKALPLLFSDALTLIGFVGNPAALNKHADIAAAPLDIADEMRKLIGSNQIITRLIVAE